MKIYDIARELFATEVYPGDPVPELTEYFSIRNGDACNLTVLKLGSHNGTHMDAPYHFIAEGKMVHQVELEQCVGVCQVLEFSGEVTESYLRNNVPPGCERLLIKGTIHLSVAGAGYLAENGVRLFGTEECTVGDSEDGVEVHRILLGADMVIIENLSLADVPAGSYLLAAIPLKIAGLDSSPCRPILIEGVI